MSAIPITLTGRETVARETCAFHFAKPPEFSFKAGQTIDLLLAGSSDALRHTFSIVSAPHEPDLVIATRMRDSEFKRALAQRPVGATLAMEGPFGSMTLHGD